jgi:hypothetical protein
MMTNGMNFQGLITKGLTRKKQISRKGFAECGNPGDHERLRLKRYDDRDITGDEII